MLRFEMDVAATDLVARTIEGTMVPYGEVANIGGADYRFAARVRQAGPPADAPARRPQPRRPRRGARGARRKRRRRLGPFPYRPDARRATRR